MSQDESLTTAAADAAAVLIPVQAEGHGEGLWLASLTIQEGQRVEAGQELARLEGKGGSWSLDSPRSGYVAGLHAFAGQMVQPGGVLCYIGGRPSIGIHAAASGAGEPWAMGGGRWIPGSGGGGAQRAAFDPSAMLLFGGGGHGKILIDLIRALPYYRLVGIIDDGMAAGSDVMGVPVVGGAETLEEWHKRGVQLAANGVGGIGNVDARVRVFERLARAGFSCPAIVHPSAVIERSAMLEAGVQVLAQAYVGGAARIGFGTALNVGAIVSHESVLGNVVNLSPGATLAGKVQVRDYAQIGMRATVNVGITVGERAILGNGCTVKQDVPPGTRVWAGSTWPVPKSTVGSKHT